jgi:hypothetical protein
MSKKTIIGVFDDESRVVNAIKKLKKENIKINDVFGPFASHDIIAAVARPSRLPHLAFLFGAGTVIATFAFLYYTSVIDYPLSYGGKPIFSFPPMVVVIYLATILLTGTLSVFTFFGISGLYPGKKANIPGDGAMDDRFFLVIDEKDTATNLAEKLMKESGALEVRHE